MLIFIRPVLGWTLGILGAAVAAKVVAKEWRRMSEELQVRTPLRGSPVQERIPVLRRDPKCGVYRPE
jgi:hypothetical protein